MASVSRDREGKSQRTRIKGEVATCVGRSVEKEGSCPWAMKCAAGSSFDNLAGVGKGVCIVATEPF